MCYQVVFNYEKMIPNAKADKIFDLMNVHLIIDDFFVLLCSDSYEVILELQGTQHSISICAEGKVAFLFAYQETNYEVSISADSKFNLSSTNEKFTLENSFGEANIKYISSNVKSSPKPQLNLKLAGKRKIKKEDLKQHLKPGKNATGVVGKKNEDNSTIICALCNKPLSLNRYLIGKSSTGKMLWKCPDCAKRGGFITVSGEKAYFCDEDGNILDTPDYNEEFKVKCDTCGHLYCYTQADLDKNKKNANAATQSAALSLLNALGGTQLGTYANLAQSERSMDKIVDYSKCPKCNSRSIRKLSIEEWEKERTIQITPKSATSVADEIKKFKELLDSNVITQEEFDAKKKQLLGL